MIKELIKKDFLKTQKNQTVSKIIGLMIKTGHKAALVFDKNKLIGVTSTALLLKTKLDPAKLKVAKVSLKVPILRGNEDIKEAARLLFTSNSPILPVIDRKNILRGVIEIEDLVAQIKYSPEARKKISDIMTPKVFLVDEDEKLGKAINLLKHHHITKLPMVNKKGVLIGIISAADILKKYHIYHQGRSDRGKGGIANKRAQQGGSYRGGNKFDFDKFPAINIASGDVVVASPDERVIGVISKMEENNISSIVVVDKKKPVGIVTMRDLLELLIKGNITF